MPPLRVFLVDDHAVVRDGLKILINAQEDLQVVGEAADGESALQALCELQPDVAIIDITIPVMNGMELISQLYSRNATTKILVLTANEDRAYVRKVLKNGVSGYLFKRSAASELIQAIRTVATGACHLDSSVVRELVEGVAAPSATAQPTATEELSNREESVIRLVALGHSNKEIATQLEISAKTVDTYKTRSMRKLNLRGRAEIVRYAMERGWLNKFL